MSGSRGAQPSAEALERSMARVVVAQICKNQGFDTVRVGALDALSEVRKSFTSLLQAGRA